jgi:hypothetical protein
MMDAYTIWSQWQQPLPSGALDPYDALSVQRVAAVKGLDEAKHKLEALRARTSTLSWFPLARLWPSTRKAQIDKQINEQIEEQIQDQNEEIKHLRKQIEAIDTRQHELTMAVLRSQLADKATMQAAMQNENVAKAFMQAQERAERKAAASDRKRTAAAARLPSMPDPAPSQVRAVALTGLCACEGLPHASDTHATIPQQGGIAHQRLSFPPPFLRPLASARPSFAGPPRMDNRPPSRHLTIGVANHSSSGRSTVRRSRIRLRSVIAHSLIGASSTSTVGCCRLVRLHCAPRRPTRCATRHSFSSMALCRVNVRFARALFLVDGSLPRQRALRSCSAGARARRALRSCSAGARARASRARTYCAPP